MYPTKPKPKLRSRRARSYKEGLNVTRATKAAPPVTLRLKLCASNIYLLNAPWCAYLLDVPYASRHAYIAHAQTLQFGIKSMFNLDDSRPLKRCVSLRDLHPALFPTTSKMLYLTKTLSLFLFISSSITICPSPQNLIQPILNSTDLNFIPTLNQTLLNATRPGLNSSNDVNLQYAGIRSPYLSVPSCDNAWKKVSLSGEPGEVVELRHRYINPPAPEV